MIVNFRLLALVMLVVIAPQASAINCKLSSGKTEDMICKDRELIRLDDSLNLVYRAAIAKSGDTAKIRSDQKRWISEVRAACTVSECLKEAYLSRVVGLQKEMRSWCQLQRGKLTGYWTRVGDNGFFEEFSAGPDGDFDSWLHQHPEISGGTWALTDCNFVVLGPSGLRIDWILTDVTKSEFYALEVGAGMARYRRTGN